MMPKKLFHVDIRRLLLVLAIGFLVAVIVVYEFQYQITSHLSHLKNNSATMAIANASSSNNSESRGISNHKELVSEANVISSQNLMPENGETLGIRFQIDSNISRNNATELGLSTFKKDQRIDENSEKYIETLTTTNTIHTQTSSQADIALGSSEGSLLEGSRNSSIVDNDERVKQAQLKDAKISPMPIVYDLKGGMNKPIITLSKMNSLLRHSSRSSHLMKPRRSSERDRDLLSAKNEIENAPIVSSSEELSTLVFRNVSRFIRSYELMEHVLRVYIYKEGETPIFHQPDTTGIYASEGWFMKLMEANKRFVVDDPNKAHLFYLPFSSAVLRFTLNKKESMEKRNLEKYLKKYVDLIAGKYSYWNRTEGADHFLVACHDWASYLTRKTMKNCIRSLCNANAGKDFKIGKDVSFPVTYINPVTKIGGKPVSKRPILAFFAGKLHGYLRPILLQHWSNKEPDMKIFGPMPRDIEGKTAYREYMRSSKYCICARGYGVHTPRVVESIFYECVPVIISDNYVPPFFEVLDWEAFAVFVEERDVPNLRNILLSIPEKKYKALQLGVKMVQKHFLWHEKPVRYDLFHMALHSVWHNGLVQVQSN